MNCWEVMLCGRQKEGPKSHELGVCSAASDVSSQGLNGGINGGRICWAVAGTFCGGKKQGTYAEKRISCMGCKFYKQVAAEQGENFMLIKP